MNSVKIYGIVVVYNRCLDESQTFNRLKDKDIKLVICDNSTSDFGNKKIAEQYGAEYVFMDGNKGLSVAYNKALSHIKENYAPDSKDRICIFDDDTTVPDEYLEKVKNIHADIALPIVRDNLGIMSPVYMPGKIAKRFKREEDAFACEGNKISGINSCLSVRFEVIDDYCYNEEMFLDYIDHQFMLDMRKKGVYPQILDVTVEQDFSAVNHSKKEADARFAMQKKDLKIFYKGNFLLYYYIVIKKHIKLFKKYVLG